MNNFEKLSKTDKDNSTQYHENYVLLKKYYKLPLINKSKCKQSALYTIVTTDKNNVALTVNDIIEKCANISTEMENAYSLLQEIFRINTFANEKTINTSLENYIKHIYSMEEKIPEFIKVADTFNSWKKEICNSFIIVAETYDRLTNGFIEGKNNMVKTFKKISYGVTSFETLRNRVIMIDQYNKQK